MMSTAPVHPCSRRRFLSWLGLMAAASLGPGCASPAPTAPGASISAPSAPPAPPAAASPAAAAAPAAPPAAPPPSAPASAPAPAPARMGTAVFRFPLAGDTPTFEPGLLNQIVPGWISTQLHAGLLTLDKDNKPAPYIAKSWEMAPDAMSLTVKLRDDVKFHHGRKVVAMDVKETWTRHLTPSVKAQIADYLKIVEGAQAILDGKSDQLTGVEVPDETTLKIRLTEPAPEFPNVLIMEGVLAKETLQPGKPEWVDKPIGAGPFKFADWQRNSKIVLEANPDFFLGRPKVDRLELLIVPDAATARAQYEAGELDVVPVGGSDLASLRSDPALSKQIQSWPNAQLSYFGFNQKVFPPFQNVKVRQAFIMAIDTGAMVDQVLQGSAERAVGLVPPGIYSYTPNVKGYPYDPAKARQLLAEAGYPDGRGFPEVTLQTASDRSTVAEAAVAQLAENLKIPVKLEVTERAEFIKRKFSRTTLQFYTWGWTATYNSPTIWLYELINSKSPTDFVNYENPNYDRIVDEARRTTDDAKRTALFQQAEQLAMDEAVLGPISFARYNYLVKPAVAGFGFNISGPLPFHIVEVKR